MLEDLEIEDLEIEESLIPTLKKKKLNLNQLVGHEINLVNCDHHLLMK